MAENNKKIKLTDKKVAKLYTDLKFPASFTGASTFYKSVKQNYPHTKIKYKKILNLLQKIPTYQYHVRTNRHYYKTRSIAYNFNIDHTNYVGGQGLSAQMDLAFMPASNDFIGFLVLIDVFNNYIYTAPFKTKKSEEIFKIVMAIIKEHSLNSLTTISSDMGQEFVSRKVDFQRENINLIPLKGAHKAFKLSYLLN